MQGVARMPPLCPSCAHAVFGRDLFKRKQQHFFYPFIFEVFLVLFY
jgi:hypothetical protein